MVDSIYRERLAITKEELYRMLAHEVNFENKHKWSKVSNTAFVFSQRLMCSAVGYFFVNKVLYIKLMKVVKSKNFNTLSNLRKPYTLIWRLMLLIENRFHS